MAGMEIGVMSSPRADGGNEFERVADFGLRATQFAVWNMKLSTRAYAKKVRSDSAQSGVRIAAIWAGYSGGVHWDFVDGPTTLGLVPARTRKRRVADLKQGADFAAWVGAPAIVTHCGFIPENASDRAYAPTVEAIAEVAKHCRKRRVGLWFETGQETPTALLRVIEDIGLPNLGINLDTANLILYGKGNPLDALDTFGTHVRNMHAKDGFYPINGRELGEEVPIGSGKVDFPKIIKRLHGLGFTGDVIIEREIKGAQQSKDIKKAVTYLRRIVTRVTKK